MGYRIEYPSFGRQPCVRKAGLLRMVIMMFGMFLLIVSVFWQEGRNLLLGLLFSGNLDETLAALETLSERLGEGAPLADAVTVFCREILNESSACVH